MSISSLKTRKIITIQRPWLWLMSLFGIVLLFAALVWMAFESGRVAAGYDGAEAAEIIDDMNQQIQQMQLKNDAIVQHNAMLERNIKIDEDAGRHIVVTYNEAQSEVQELKKELEFYKSIITPEETKRSVSIHGIQVDEREDGGFEYKITISQKGRNDNKVSGKLKLAVTGKKFDKPETLTLDEISDDKTKDKRFGFKYFQTFEGVMVFPDGFWPEFLQIEVKPKLSSIESIVEQFTWAELTAGEMQNVGQ